MHYGALHAQGVAQRQAAQVLDVPRSPLPAWRLSHDRLEACPTVVAFLHSVSGLAFLPRLGIALPVVCSEIGACGIRLVCLLWALTGLHRFVGASYGTQQQVNRRVAEAIVAYGRAETARLAQAMPPQDMTVTQDATLTGGLCLVGIEPMSHYMLLEQAAQARDHDTWQECMEPALARLHCQGIQSTSDEAPGLLAYVDHHRGAHHAPDLFPGQPARSKAISAPLAVKQRAAIQAVVQAEETRTRMPEDLANSHGTPVKRGPGRPPKVPGRLEQATQAAAAARQEP